MDTIASRLRSARTSKGLTQQRLAELARLSVMTVSHAENGAEPRDETLSALAQALEVSPAWLRYGEHTVTSAGAA